MAPTPKPSGTTSFGKTSGGGGDKKEAKPRDDKPVDPPSSTPKKGKEAEEDDFDKAFGGDSSKSASKKETKPAASEEGVQKDPTRKTGYIPPPPGQANIPDSLTQSDIVGAVLEHKSALASCTQEHKKKDPAAKGTIVMQFQIQTSGKASNVSVATDEMKGTPLGTCLGGVIKGMTFPKHKKQGEPTKFPFKF